jgi:GNAT superfamily N-acetyltransferase
VKINSKKLYKNIKERLFYIIFFLFFDKLFSNLAFDLKNKYFVLKYPRQLGGNLSVVFVISQIIGFLAFGLQALSLWQKDRRKILLLKIGDSLLYSVHYFLLGAWPGACINIIGAVRSWSFIYKNKNKFLSTYALPIIFLFAYVITAALTWQGPITILPTLGSIILMFSIWQNNTKIIRRYGLAVQVLWLAYAIFVGTWVVVFTETVLMISAITAIIRLDILKQAPEKYKIVINGYLGALEKIFDTNNQFLYDKKSIKNPDYIKFVYVKGNKPLGYIAVYPKDDFMQQQGFPPYEPVSPFSVFIWHIAVRKGHQRQGIATVLLNEIKKIYHGYEIYSVLDTRNNASILFHSTNGFVKKFDFMRVYFGKLQKFDLMQLKTTTKELPAISTEPTQAQSQDDASQNTQSTEFQTTTQN